MTVRIRFKRFRLVIRQPRHASFRTFDEVRAALVPAPSFNRVC